MTLTTFAGPMPLTQALADIFPKSTRADWLAAARRSLKGAAIETLASRTIEGIEIAALYAADEARPRPAFDPPWRTEADWDVRTLVRHPQIVHANQEIRGALVGGATSVLVRIDPAEPASVTVDGPGAMAAVLEGVSLDTAAIALDAGFLAVGSAEWLSAAAKASPGAPLAFHLDPLTAFARAGAAPGPIEGHVVACAVAAANLSRIHPRASLFLASGRALHEAGGGEAGEIALAAAGALAYARALDNAGLPPAEALPRIVLGLAVDTDPLLGIAKLRAARMVWRRIAVACGAESAARIEARTSERMLTAAEPWTNLVRIATAGFAAAVGGADTIAPSAFTDAIGLPAALARRLARNTALIIAEEARVCAVADPAGGSWAFEALSADLARAAWGRLQAIEAAGGAAAALSAGLIARWAGEGAKALEGEIACGQRKIVGVTDWRPEHGDPVEVEPAPTAGQRPPPPGLPGPASHCPALAPIRLEALAR